VFALDFLRVLLPDLVLLGLDMPLVGTPSVRVKLRDAKGFQQLLRNLHVIECQLDELWSFVHTKQHQLPFARLYDDTYGDAWVWVAFAPVWRLVVAFVIGKRTQQSANLLLDRVLHVTDAHVPFFTSDQ